MYKSQLVKLIAEQAHLSQDQAKRAVDAFIQIVQATLQQGGKVTLFGFGAFKVNYRKASKNHVRPGTNIPLPRPAAKIPSFKAGKSLKNALK